MLTLLALFALWPQGPTDDPTAAWLDRLDQLAWPDARHQTFGPTGKRLWVTRLAARPGLCGELQYIHHGAGLSEPLPLEFVRGDGTVLTAKPKSSRWLPTHAETEHELSAPGLRVLLREHEWITTDDVWVARLTLDGATEPLQVRWRSPLAERPTGAMERFSAVPLAALASIDLVQGSALRRGGADAAIWWEAEAPARQQGSTGRDPKRAALGGEVLGRDFGGRAGDEAAWEFASTGVGQWTLALRYAREAAAPARYTVTLRGQPLGEIVLPPTGGWGGREEEFGIATCELGTIPAGLCELALTASGAGANANLDALYLAPAGQPIPPARTWPSVALPRLRGGLVLEPGAGAAAGVPFALLPPLRAQAVAAATPIPVAGKGSVLHALVVKLAEPAAVRAGDAVVTVPGDAHAHLPVPVRLVVRATEPLSCTAQGCVVLAITREVPPEAGLEIRQGAATLHGVRTEIRASLRGPLAGTTWYATLEFSGNRQPLTATREALAAADPLQAHRLAYAGWFARHAPRFRCGDPLLDRLWVYRWFLVRHNLAWPEAGYLPGPVVYEGRHGAWYPRVITFSTPHIVAETRWLADPQICLANLYAHARAADADGVLRNLLIDWQGAHYENWIPEAAVEAFKVLGDKPAARSLLPMLARATAADLKVFDPDGDGLPAPGDHYATGMEFQPAFWFDSGYDDRKPPARLERPEFAAYAHGNARAVAEAARWLDDAPLAAAMQALAERTQQAALAQLWHEEDAFFYSAREHDGVLARAKEIVGFYPFRFGLAPDAARYARAFAALLDPEQFWTPFPLASCSKQVPAYTPHIQQWPLPGGIATACMWNGPTWPHANSLIADTIARALRSQHPGPLRAEHLAAFLRAFARFHAEGGDPQRLLLREYGDAETGVNWGCADYMHSTWNDLIIRHAAGLVPRFDDALVVRPLECGIDEFVLEDVPCRGHRVGVTRLGKRLRVFVDGVLAGEGSVADGLFLGGALR